MMARRKGNQWYIGGINSENRVKMKTINFDFLKEGVEYRLKLIADGEHDKDFSISYRVVNRSSSVEVRLLRRGGFTAELTPLE